MIFYDWIILIVPAVIIFIAGFSPTDYFPVSAVLISCPDFREQGNISFPDDRQAKIISGISFTEKRNRKGQRKNNLK